MMNLAVAPNLSPFYERLQALRDALKAQALDGFLVPMADAYQNEYVAPSDRRIEFLTGFSGSSAFVIVLADRAAFFTDSRYTLQAQGEVSPSLFTLFDVAEKTPHEWLEENLLARMALGFDPTLHTLRQSERFELLATRRAARLVPLEANPIDALWTDRPCAPCAPIVPYDEGYAGKASAAKRYEIAETLRKKNAQAAVLVDPASVAWLLNVRGGDVPYTPLPLSMAIVRADGGVEWFVDSRKMTPQTQDLCGSDVLRHEEGAFLPALRRLGEAKARVWIDPNGASFFVVTALRKAGAELVFERDPCALPRARKNATEVDGMRAAHRRDGAALVKCLAWIDQVAPQGGINERDVEEKLESFRASAALYRGPSFAPIVASGPNGAIVHYRSNERTCRLLDHDSFLLIDSGGQYLDGTTDVTRTVPLGTLTSEMRERYTRVLKGHIALAAAVFPKGTTGGDLDVLARQYLWEAGLDYGHGTGHGVGCYLGVHEGPQSLSRRNATPLELGMILSIEPGFYKAKRYGLRLENLYVVVERLDLESPDMKMMGFEPLTLVPFDRRAIDKEGLSSKERAWLDAYHARVASALRPLLDTASIPWLLEATASL